MIGEKFDYLKEAGTLIDILRKDGRAEDARALQEAIDEGSTGTEIVMALRWHLDKLLKQPSGLTSLLQQRSRRLLEQLEKILSS